jgi:tetratricopeptide (TPR) repeat protein
MATGDLQSANATLLQTLQALRSSLGSGHPQVAKVLNNLGVVEFEMGAIHNGFKSLEEAHDVQCRLGLGLRSRFPQRHEFAELAVSNTLSNLGFVYAKQYKYSDAARMYQEAFRLQSKYLHAKHPTLTRTSENVEYVQARVIEQRNQNVVWQTLSGAMSCGG